MRRYYVTVTWDNFPEGDSFGEITEASNPAEAVENTYASMAATREDEDTSADEIRDMFEHEWHVIDCFDLDEFIEMNKRAAWGN